MWQTTMKILFYFAVGVMIAAWWEAVAVVVFRIFDMFLQIRALTSAMQYMFGADSVCDNNSAGCARDILADAGGAIGL